MRDPQEQSYYEIALTSRQVAVAFILVLGLVLAVFFAGVWVGLGGQGATESASAPLPERAAIEARADSDESRELGSPQRDLRQVAEEPDPETSLLEDLMGSTPAPPRSSRSGPESEEEREPEDRALRPAELPASQRSSREARAGTGAAADVAITSAAPSQGEEEGPLVIQVFSSPDGEQARRLVSTLRGDGFSAFLSPVQVGNQVMHRVRIGPFEERESAERVAREVRQKHRLDTWITR